MPDPPPPYSSAAKTLPRSVKLQRCKPATTQIVCDPAGMGSAMNRQWEVLSIAHKETFSELVELLKTRVKLRWQREEDFHSLLTLKYKNGQVIGIPDETTWHGAREYLWRQKDLCWLEFLFSFRADKTTTTAKTTYAEKTTDVEETKRSCVVQ